MSELILFTSDDGQTQMHLRVESGTIWLSQAEIAELFQTTKQNVSLHAKNILEEGELQAGSVVKESLTTASDNKNYRTKLYNLDLILAIGYRVRSPRGTQFRQWATTNLREFLVKGFAMDDQRTNSGVTDFRIRNSIVGTLSPQSALLKFSAPFAPLRREKSSNFVAPLAPEVRRGEGLGVRGLSMWVRGGI
jgi:hypothetical protein